MLAVALSLFLPMYSNNNKKIYSITYPVLLMVHAPHLENYLKLDTFYIFFFVLCLYKYTSKRSLENF